MSTENTTVAKKVRKATVKAEVFIAAIMNSTCLDAAAETLGLAPSSVYQRYNKYRNDGVLLPNRPQSDTRKKRFDVKALNALIDAKTQVADATKTDSTADAQ